MIKYFHEKALKDIFSDRLNEILLSALYAVGLVVILNFLSYDINSGGDEWRQGDWLINNDILEIRRGWLGSILLDISRYFKLNAIYIVVVAQGLITTLIFLTAWIAGLKLRNNDIAFFLLISPVFIMFWFNDLEGSVRKEILAYLAFTPFVFAAINNDGSKKLRYVLLSLTIFFIASFSHEANTLFLPFYIASLIIINKKIDRFVLLLSLVYIVISISGFLYAILNSSINNHMVICKPIIETGVSDSICEGAIRWLEYDTLYAFERVEKLISSEKLYSFFIAYIFSLLIFVYLMKEYFAYRFLIAVSLIVASFFVPLYIIAIDWGRWINFYVVSITFLIIIWMLSQKQSLKNIKFSNKKYTLFLIFFSSWGVTHIGGYFSLKNSYALNIAHVISRVIHKVL